MVWQLVVDASGALPTVRRYGTWTAETAEGRTVLRGAGNTNEQILVAFDVPERDYYEVRTGHGAAWFGEMITNNSRWLSVVPAACLLGQVFVRWAGGLNRGTTVTYRVATGELETPLKDFDVDQSKSLAAGQWHRLGVLPFFEAPHVSILVKRADAVAVSSQEKRKKRKRKKKERKEGRKEGMREKKEEKKRGGARNMCGRVTSG